MSEEVLGLVRSCQRRVDCHLGGGAALSGAYLGHRLSGDVDLFCHDPAGVRALVRELPDVGRECGLPIALVRDSGTFVRARVSVPGRPLELDLVHESLPDLEAPPAPLDGLVVESLVDLRAAKLTCLLSRSEPRDLVDVLFLDRAGFPPERDLALALRKDAGIDPGVLAWLLGQFPVRPLPVMLTPLTEAELAGYRDALRERLRQVALGAVQ
jgi:hypothetical protein